MYLPRGRGGGLERIWVLNIPPEQGVPDGFCSDVDGNLWIDPAYPTPWRNLALVYFNQQNDPAQAQKALETAFALDKSDARIFLELDQMYKKRGVSPAERLENFEANRETFEQLWSGRPKPRMYILRRDTVHRRRPCRRQRPPDTIFTRVKYQSKAV